MLDRCPCDAVDGYQLRLLRLTAIYREDPRVLDWDTTSADLALGVVALARAFKDGSNRFAAKDR